MLIPLLFLATPDAFTKSTDLYLDCKSLIVLAEDTSNQNHGDPARAEECMGYIEGMADGADHVRGFCVGNATIGTMAKVYTAYMDKNPKMFDQPRGDGFVAALQDAYPCPAK